MSWFSNATVTQRPDMRAVSLTEGVQEETKGSFIAGTTLRVVQPWRGGVPAGVPMQIKIESGDASFGTIQQTTAGTKLENLGKTLILGQPGQTSKPDRVYYLVAAGTQKFNSLMTNGSVTSQPTRKEAGEISLSYQIGDMEPETFTTSIMTGPDDHRPDRVRHFVFTPRQADGSYTAEMRATVDDTCLDRMGDCKETTYDCMSATARAAGSVLFSTASTLRHPIDTGKTVGSAVRNGASLVGKTVQKGAAWTFGLKMPEEKTEKTE